MPTFWMATPRLSASFAISFIGAFSLAEESVAVQMHPTYPVGREGRLS